MNADDIVTVGRALPRLASAVPAGGPFAIAVAWAAGARAGRTEIVDLAPAIVAFKVFRPLRDGTVPFDSMRLSGWGASIVWGDGGDLDLGAETIEELARGEAVGLRGIDRLGRATSA